MKILRTKTAIIGLLVIYGVVLALVSYQVFNNKSNSKFTVAQQPVSKQVESFNTGKSVDLAIRNNSEIVLTPNGNKISVVQFSIILPLNDSFKAAKGTLTIPGFKQVANETVVDKANNRILVNLAGYNIEGYTSTVPVTVAKVLLNGKPVSPAVLTFNRPITKVHSLDNGLALTINYK